MNYLLHHITSMLMSMTAAAYLLCGMVLWLGGWLSNERKYHSTKLQKYLSVSDFITGITIMMLVLVEAMPEEAQPAWFIILDWLCYVPIAMFYPESTLLCQQRPGWKSWVHAFGLMVIGLPVMLIWGKTYPIVSMLTLGIILSYILLLYAYSLFRLRRWDRQMCEEFSDVSHKQTAWFRRLTLPFIGLMLMWIPQYLYPEQEWLNIIYYLVSPSLAVAMSSHALAHEEFDFDASVLSTSDVNMIDNEDNAIVADGDVTASEPATTDRPLWVERLNAAMREQCLYRQADLTLTRLADEIGINRTYLSQYFNQSEAGSFYNYIASCRIEDAKKQLEDTDIPLNEIASFCGFTSQASFSRTFKNYVGATPTEYRKQNINE